MPTNDQVILDRLLEQEQRSISPDTDLGEFFRQFSTEQLLKAYDLSYDELEAGNVEGGGDGGIDSIFVFVNGQLVTDETDVGEIRSDVVIDIVLVQSKTATSFSETPVEKMASSLSDLLNLGEDLDELAAVYNRKLRAAVANFRRVYLGLTNRFPRVRFHCFYATKSGDVPHHNVTRKVELVENGVRGNFRDAEFHFSFIGARELLELARTSPAVTHTLRIAEGPLSSGSSGYVCLVKLPDFYRLITTESGELDAQVFDANVRDYQGSTEVNEGIKRTLQQADGDEFWWLNNGITIVATRATFAGKNLTLENPQIVNGLQTSSEIYKHFSVRSDARDDRSILVRIIEPPSDGSRDRIIRATNSQTVLPPASLRATDRLQRDLEDYFGTRGLFYDRRKNYYKNRGKPKASIVSIPYLAQAMAAIVLRKPDDARARPSSLLKRDESYLSVFNPNYPIELFLKVVLFMRRVEEFLRTSVTDMLPSERNDLKFHLAAFTAARYAGRIDPSPVHLAATGLEDIDDDYLKECLDLIVEDVDNLVATGVFEARDTDKIAKSPSLMRSLTARFSAVIGEDQRVRESSEE